MYRGVIKSFFFISTALAATLERVSAMDAPGGEKALSQLISHSDQSRKRVREVNGEEEKVPQEVKKPRLEDNQVSFEELVAQAEAGDPYAQYALARCYAKGKGVEQNNGLAFEWYEKAAHQGLAKAQARLAHCYLRGSGLPYNYHSLSVNQWTEYTKQWEEKSNMLAFQWYEKAAKQGFAKGQSGLAHFYQKGLVVPQDVSLALQLYEEAANQGDWKAQMELYEYYKESEDYSLAIKWLGKVIEHENPLRGRDVAITLGSLENIPTENVKELSELLQPLVEMAQTLTCENDIRSNLNKSHWSQGRYINPRLSTLYGDLANFNTVILRIIKQLQEPGFMVRFEDASWVPDGSLAPEAPSICRYSLLQGLICLGKEAVEVGNLLQDLIGDEERPGSAKFKQLRLKVGDELNMSRQSLESLELKRMTLKALIQSCCLPLGNDDSKRAYQTKLRQIAERYNILENFGDALSGSESQSIQQVIKLRKIRLAEYLDKMVLVEQAIENQKLAHDFLQNQLGMLEKIKLGLQEALYQGINERNNLLRAAYPGWLED